jgi:hypothetical protein
MTTTATLTDRYIDAAMRTVPEKQRSDLSAELRASIDDQIDARADAGEPRDAAERAVLTELGDPDKLAARYTDRPLHLIGPRYYLEWWRLLKLLLWIVPACAAFGIALGQALSGASLGEVIGSTVVGVMGVVIHLFFWVTVVFAILERNPGKSGLERSALTKDGPWSPWTLEQLPQPRESGARLPDLIASLVFLVLGAAAILWDLLVGFVPGSDLSFLSPGLWPGWVAGLFVLMALEAILAYVVYRVGRWTFPLAVANAVLAVAIAVPAIWLLTQGQLLNPEFFPTLVPDDGAEVSQIIAIITGFGIAFIALWDIIDAFLKARRAR